MTPNCKGKLVGVVSCNDTFN